ncbi:MAG: acyl-CoA dehydrogenase family protein, partial [Gelidibacter sp.]
MKLFNKIKSIIQLMKEVDLKELGEISEKIDLPKIMKTVGELDDKQLNGLMKMLTEKAKKGQHQLPPIDGDFYDLDLKLNQQQRAIQMKVRNFMETEVQPITNDYWKKAEFPFEIIPKLAKLDICGVAYEGYGCPNLPFIMEGIIAEELARVDVSVSTFFGVHSGLAMGSIYL